MFVLPSPVPSLKNIPLLPPELLYAFRRTLPSMSNFIVGLLIPIPTLPPLARVNRVVIMSGKVLCDCISRIWKDASLPLS